jgi:hypothetical protein
MFYLGCQCHEHLGHDLAAVDLGTSLVDSILEYATATDDGASR